MSAQRGSGHPTGPVELRRTESVRLMVREGERSGESGKESCPQLIKKQLTGPFWLFSNP